MKIFLSFRFTGEDPKILVQTNKKIVNALGKSGHTVSDSMQSQDYFAANHFSNKQILEHTLQELDQADVYLAYINSDQRSEGMLIELGYALAKGKKIIVAVKKGSRTYTPELASEVIEYENLEELYQKLEQLNLEQIK